MITDEDASDNQRNIQASCIACTSRGRMLNNKKNLTNHFELLLTADRTLACHDRINMATSWSGWRTIAPLEQVLRAYFPGSIRWKLFGRLSPAECNLPLLPLIIDGLTPSRCCWVPSSLISCEHGHASALES